MPIICSADIREAYFRLRISPEAKLSSLFLMDFDTQTKQLTAKVTQHSKLVTIQTKVSIMGVNQSGSFLSLSLQDLTKDIEDPILRYFLRYLRYLDDLQSGVVAEEIEELQKGVNLQDPALEMQCDDSDCCKDRIDLPPTPENMLGGALPEDEKKMQQATPLQHNVWQSSATQASTEICNIRNCSGPGRYAHQRNTNLTTKTFW